MFLRPYLQVVFGGVVQLLWLLVVGGPPYEPRETRTNVLGDINPQRPADVD